MDRLNHVPVRPSLLLVDDCTAQRDLYEAVLAPDFDVLTAARGEEGLVLATETHPDAIVLDVMMPGMDGWETCAHIKRNAATAHIPVILLTGTEASDLQAHAAEVGASALLMKPCPADYLCEVIRTTLGEPWRKVVWTEKH